MRESRLKSSRRIRHRLNPDLTSAREAIRNRAIPNVGAWIPLTAIALLAMFLLTYNISFFPYISMDEGGHLSVPKTLVTEGEYAQKTAHGYNYYGPVVATGPTVMLPIALSFELFGIGLSQARAITGMYILATLFVFYIGAKHLFGRNTAVLAAGLLLVAPGFILSNWPEGGRIVVGEVPAMFFFMSGMVLFWKWMDRRQTSRLLLVGVLWGLAFMTKNQFPMIVLPTFALSGLLGRYYYRAIRLRDMAIPLAVACAVFAIWPIAQFVAIGGDNVANNLSSIRSSSSSNYLVFSPGFIKESARYLISIDVYYGWAVPAIAYGLILSLRRSVDGFKLMLISGVIVIWLLWYVIPSIGYPRYSYPPLQLSVLFLAKLFADLIGRIELPNLNLIRRWTLGRDLHRAMHVGLVLMLALIIGSPLEREVRQTLSATAQSSPEHIAHYLTDNVEHGAIIATIDYGLALYTDHLFHYPPSHVLSASERYYAGKDPHSVFEYDPVDAGATYLAIGPYGRHVSVIYEGTNLEHCWTRIHEVDVYELYELNPEQSGCARARSGSMNALP